MVERYNTTTIRVTNEFKDRLATHGQFGERFEDILIRLLGDKFMNTATGDRDTKVYSGDDVDSRSTLKKHSEATLQNTKRGKK